MGELVSHSGVTLTIPATTTTNEVSGNVRIVRFTHMSGQGTVALYGSSSLALYDNKQAVTDQTAVEVSAYERAIPDQSNYGYVSHLLNLTEDSVGLFKTDDDLVVASIMLRLKRDYMTDTESVRSFQNSHGVRGFIKEYNGNYHIAAFSRNDTVHEVVIAGLPENEMGAMVASLKVE
jgi:hypothetical protein